jgi:hypothetical protein
VENAALRLEVSDANGSIVSLRDKRTDTEFVADRSLARLFELLMPDASNYSRRIVSWKQTAVDVQSRDSAIEIRFEGLKPDEEQYSFGSGLLHVAQPVLDIDVRVTLALDGDHVTAALELTNRSLVTITGVAFPYVGGLPQRTATGPASVVVPSVSERVYTSTLGALSGQKALRYPGMLATSWLSYELPQATGSQPASLGLEVRSGLESQDAYFSLSPGPFKPGSAYRGRYEYPFVAWIHYPHVAGRGQWRTPPTLLHVHAADWHAVAAEHREWYRAKAPMQRGKTRDNGLGFATYLLKDDENNIRWRYDELPALGAAAMEAGLHTIVVDGWRQREGPSNPAPFGESRTIGSAVQRCCHG